MFPVVSLFITGRSNVIARGGTLFVDDLSKIKSIHTNNYIYISAIQKNIQKLKPCFFFSFVLIEHCEGKLVEGNSLVLKIEFSIKTIVSNI